MAELLKRDVVIRYIDEERPHIESIRTNKEVALHQWQNWWEYRFGPEPKIIDITVDGEVFTPQDLMRRD